MRYSPSQLARLLGLPEPTAEQAVVISAPMAPHAGAAVAPLEPLAVIAGAGSGKSETMAGRLVWLVANGFVRPERVLGLTFTRKAAAELGERVRARLADLRRAGIMPGAGGAAGNPTPGGPLAPGAAADPLAGEPVVSTYHAYAARLVADHALREGLEPSLRLITPAVAWQLASRAVAAYGGPMDAVGWAPQGVTAAVLALAGELAEHLRGIDEVRGTGDWLAAARERLPGAVPRAVTKIINCQRTREQLLPMVAAYAAAKRAREVIDHGDQVALAARIARNHPEVGAAERARYQVVLLDEYQDTSHAQLVLLRALFGGGHPVTAVGDPCQSIYGWRGASAGNLRRFQDDFAPRRGGRSGVRLLSTSFRNTGRVLDAAAAIQHELRAAAPGLPLLVPPPGRADRGEVVCALTETAAAEAEWVAQRIEGLLALPAGIAPDGQPWPDHRPDGVRPADIAVLCRKRSQFPALRSAIEARGIPVEVIGLGGLLTVPEVADIVATLRVLHDPTASAPLARLLTGPRWRLGPRDLVALGLRARELTREQRHHAGGQRPPADPPPRDPPPRDHHVPEDQQPGPDGPPDPLERAVTDLTADSGSLVEALDDLGNPATYSPAGHARLTALAAELRGLRTHAGRPLPDLVGEVERTLGLDVEVAARPGADPAAARADLDAFADAAAAFADDEAEPTLGAFLAYLAAAEEEEFGLESGRSGGSGGVVLATVHAAKGLQWPAVIVPGLARGEKAQVFPARPRTTTRWTENPRLLPFSLRGDAADLPGLADLSARALSGFTADCAARDHAEERRLAYVAVTRAAYWLACTGYWWGDGVSRLGPSEFLTEVRGACEAGAGPVAQWAPEPDPDAENPALAEPAAADWPATPAGERYEAVREAAALVEKALAGHSPAGGGTRAAKAPAAVTGPVTAEAPASADAADGARVEDGLSDADRALVTAWERDTTLLLAERERRRAEVSAGIPLPGRLSVASLVAMARDPAGLAQQIRRPMPRPPAPGARRGTAFHRWLEERFGQQRLIDPGDLLGAADDPADGEAGGDAADLALLRERFEAGAWADRWPSEVEVGFETLLADRVVRGRIDAVFADAPEGGFDVVDWKTGQPPSGEGELRAAAVQLAAYRVAWAALAGVPASEVRAAFYYVREDLTLRPADLLDEAGLAALVEQLPDS